MLTERQQGLRSATATYSRRQGVSGIWPDSLIQRTAKYQGIQYVISRGRPMVLKHSHFLGDEKDESESFDNYLS